MNVVHGLGYSFLIAFNLLIIMVNIAGIRFAWKSREKGFKLSIAAIICFVIGALCSALVIAFDFMKVLKL